MKNWKGFGRKRSQSNHGIIPTIVRRGWKKLRNASVSAVVLQIEQLPIRIRSSASVPARSVLLPSDAKCSEVVERFETVKLQDVMPAYGISVLLFLPNLFLMHYSSIVVPYYTWMAHLLTDISSWKRLIYTIYDMRITLYEPLEKSCSVVVSRRNIRLWTSFQKSSLICFFFYLRHTQTGP
jgi:hypothetical protein